MSTQNDLITGGIYQSESDGYTFLLITNENNQYGTVFLEPDPTPFKMNGKWDSKEEHLRFVSRNAYKLVGVIDAEKLLCLLKP